MKLLRLRMLPALLPLLAALLLATAPAASAREALPHAVTVDGNVVNSSHGDAPLANQAVTLVEIAAGQSASVASATTDSHGVFTFARLTPDPDASYQLDVQYQGGAFTSSAYDATQIGAQPVTLHVFDTTSDDSTVLVALTTLVVGEPDAQAGMISVAESVTVYNTGLKAYVATIQPIANKPMNLLRFVLPTNAKNLVLGAGFATVQVIQAPTGFGAIATVPPGSTEFAFAYDLPYSASAVAVTTKSAYTSRQIVALVPTDMHLAPGDFAQKPNVDAAGGHFQLLEQDNVATGKTLSFTLRDLPRPGQPQYLDVRALGAIGLLFALLLLGALFVYLRRGNLAPLLGLARVQLPTHALASPRDGERKALLRQHLALDELRKAGKLSAADYERQRGDLRERLRAILAEQQAKRDGARLQKIAQRGARAVAIPRSEAQPRPAPPKVPATPGGAA
jgi:hypothetical protein